MPVSPRFGGHLSKEAPALTLRGLPHAGIFIPSCDEDGYYRKMQCDQSSGDCWCVDQLGLELTGTRTHGSPDCGKPGVGSRGPPLAGLGFPAGRVLTCPLAGSPHRRHRGLLRGLREWCRLGGRGGEGDGGSRRGDRGGGGRGGRGGRWRLHLVDGPRGAGAGQGADGRGDTAAETWTEAGRLQMDPENTA